MLLFEKIILFWHNSSIDANSVMNILCYNICGQRTITKINTKIGEVGTAISIRSVLRTNGV